MNLNRDISIIEKIYNYCIGMIEIHHFTALFPVSYEMTVKRNIKT